MLQRNVERSGSGGGRGTQARGFLEEFETRQKCMTPQRGVAGLEIHWLENRGYPWKKGSTIFFFRPLAEAGLGSAGERLLTGCNPFQGRVCRFFS